MRHATHITLRLTVIVTLALTTLALATTTAAAAPRSFAGVELPDEVLPVWLISSEYMVQPGGAEQLVATIYELDQRIPSTSNVERHFERLAERNGWVGGFDRLGDKTDGYFQKGNVSVHVELAGPRGAGRISLTIRVAA